jgi:hypothetical protein
VSRSGKAVTAAVATLLLLSPTVEAAGVGGATWTPSESTTSAQPGRFLVEGDAIDYRTEASWDREQARGLEGYLTTGLRYTHEVNDRSGRLSATGYWATNYPDPAYDRDDDDADGRWEEAEIIAGRKFPEVGRTYVATVQFSRWHGKRSGGACDWAWDRRMGHSEILSQLSRELLGEWQAERYTLTYETKPYARVGQRPPLPAGVATARCRDQRPSVNQEGKVVTFSRPISWAVLADLITVGSGKWTAFEAMGSSQDDDLLWTCGGPVDDAVRLSQCRAMGIRPHGITAAVGYFDSVATAQLRDHPAVIAIDTLRDSLTGLLFEVGGFGVEPPGLTINDRYWELVLAD